MRSPGWLGLVGAALIAGLAAVPAHAAPSATRQAPPARVVARAPVGAVTLGRLAPAGAFACIDNYLWLQAFANADQPTYSVPFGGVITSVSHFANSQPSATIQAVFVKPTATAGTFGVAQRSPVLTVTANQLNTFPVRIPVEAGEVLALRTVTGQARCVGTGGSIDQDYIGDLDDTASSWTLDGSNLHVFVNLSAVWEPDEDGDGYGDVSQDGCPARAAVHDPCPAPVVTVTKKPAKRVSAPKVKVKFRADVAGSGFACSTDGRAFKRCRSPYEGKFLPGTHTVRVQATSPVGVTGQPVTVQFKVVTPRVT